jgi:hypothetical protein
MKLLAFWFALAAAVLWWATPHQTDRFAARWVQLPPAIDLAGLPDRKGRRSAALILRLARLRQMLDHLNKGANP